MASRTEQDRLGSRIEFISAHRPAIQATEFTVQLIQSLSITAPVSTARRYVGKVQKIRLQAPAARLNPDQIKAVYPPAGSLGEYRHSLPHVVLTPSTLPWERNAVPGQQELYPWLVLLLFTEEEYQQVILSSPDAQGNPNRPAPAMIELPADLLSRVMPRKGDLKFLSHVRQNLDASGKLVGEETAVILGHRLPAAAGNIVHLVAVDGRFAEEQFPAPNTPAAEKIKLVTFKSWRFHSTDPQQSFVSLLKGLEQLPFQLNWHREGLQEYFFSGSTLLPHHMREGNKTASWYHGPLLSDRNTRGLNVKFPVRSSDSLVIFDESLGLFDVSYAVAWELGRLLMLQNKGVALALYQWKQSHTQVIKSAVQQIGHLPFAGPSADLELPGNVVRWFERTALLEGIPFHNLVADENLLPAESIRFFELDWQWLECLFDGAFSIGRITATDYRNERDTHTDVLKWPTRRMSGFLMRSAVVAGWPGLQIEGFDTDIPEVSSATQLLFKLESGSLGTALANGASADEAVIQEIREAFENNGYPLADQPFTIDQRGWEIIENGLPVYELTPSSNDHIDVRTYRALDASSPERSTEQPFVVDKFVGQIDGDFEIDLYQSRYSKPLARAFANLEIKISEALDVRSARWFLAEDDGHNYLIERHGHSYWVFLDHQLPLLRMEHLSKNVLICLFEGKIKAIDVYLKPETLHHGVNSDGAGAYTKHKRDGNGVLINNDVLSVPFRNTVQRVIDIQTLADQLTSSKESSEFAFQMVEGTPKVRFSLRPK